MKRIAKKVIVSIVAACMVMTLIAPIGNATVNAASSKSWCFKDSSFKSLGKITSTKTVDGLSLIATIGCNATASLGSYRYSGAISVPSGVHITGKNNATIDFSKTSGSSGRGLTFAGKGSNVSNITVKNASDNGIFISGTNNTFRYVTCTNNKDAGYQVSNGGAYNKFYHCYSHHNCDAKGENADGFAVKKLCRWI